MKTDTPLPPPQKWNNLQFWLVTCMNFNMRFLFHSFHHTVTTLVCSPNWNLNRYLFGEVKRKIAAVAAKVSKDAIPLYYFLPFPLTFPSVALRLLCVYIFPSISWRNFHIDFFFFLHCCSLMLLFEHSFLFSMWLLIEFLAGFTLHTAARIDSEKYIEYIRTAWWNWWQKRIENNVI